MISARQFAISVLFGLFALFFASTLFTAQLSSLLATLFGDVNSYDQKRMLLLGFIALAALITPFVSQFRLPRLTPFTLTLLAALFVIGLVSALANKHPYWSLLELANAALLLALFVMLAFSVTTLGQQRAMVWLFWFAMFFTAGMLLRFLLALVFHLLDGVAPDIHSLVWGFMNVRFFNQLQSMLMPVLCLAFLHPGLTQYRRYAMLALGAMWLMLLQSSGRGTVLAVVLASMLVLVLLPRRERGLLQWPLLQAFALGFVLWLLLIVCLPLLLLDVQTFTLRTDSSGRIDMWLYILKHIPEQPLLGFGPMAFAWAEGKPIPHAHPHNALMQVLYEYGLPLCLLLCAWLLYQGRALCRRLRARPDAAHDSAAFDGTAVDGTACDSTAFEPSRCHSTEPGATNAGKTGIDATQTVLAYALGSGLLYSLFCGVIVMPLAQALWVCLCALNVAPAAHSMGMEASRWQRAAAAMAVLALAVVLFGSYGAEDLSPAGFPRFWSHGLVT